MIKINLSKEIDRNTFVGNLLLHTMTEYENRHKLHDIVKTFKVSEWTEVKIVINGVETDFDDYMRILEQQIDKLVLEKAKTLIEDKISTIYNKLDDIQSRTLECLTKAKDRVGY